MKNIKSFKIKKGEALEAIQSIATTTYRNLSGALEFLVIKGFKQHEIEKQILKENKLNNKKGDLNEK
jgi:hypothetical protein